MATSLLCILSILKLVATMPDPLVLMPDPNVIIRFDVDVHINNNGVPVAGCCEPKECTFNGQPGVCSKEAKPPWVNEVGTQECKDECKCYIKGLITIKPIPKTSSWPTTSPRPTTTTFCQSQRTTVCPDGTRCHKNAHCFLGLHHYICGVDSKCLANSTPIFLAFDGDRVGDVCDNDTDTDKDGIQDGLDNCINVYNHGQSDVDFDGLGDACDDDADNDGITNLLDNCWIVPNPGQEDADNDGFGDACQDDKDGDCLPDHIDICPKDPKIHSVDFRYFHLVSLDKSFGQRQPKFIITDHGKEVTQELNSKPGLMFGQHVLSGLDFDGTFYIGQNSDDDYAGFIFGYHDSKKFYVVMWKKHDQRYWEGSNSYGEAGLALKKVHSTTGPSEIFADALWATKNTTDQVTLLWHDSNKIGWNTQQPYRWELIHRPHIGLIRVRFLIGADVIADSGNIYDEDIESGYLGVYCHSQEKITWSNLDYRCNDESVPQEVYDDLPFDKQEKVIVNPSKSWSGTVKTLKTKPNSKLVLHEPGMDDLTTLPYHN